MYVYQTSEDNLTGNKHFNDKKVDDCKKLEEVWHWYNHPRLHKCFENLYLEKGGKCEDIIYFNGESVKLTIEDIHKLENVLRTDWKTINNGFTNGCFFREYVTYYNMYNRDKKFIHKAIEILNNNNCLIYSKYDLNM